MRKNNRTFSVSSPSPQSSDVRAATASSVCTRVRPCPLECLLEPGLNHGSLSAGVHDFNGVDEVSARRKEHFVHWNVFEFQARA